VALLITVHDWNRIGADKLLGQAIVRVAQGAPEDAWHGLVNESGAPVQGKDGPAQILLHVSYRWTRQSAATPPPVVVVKEVPAAALLPSHAGEVDTERLVKEAAVLRARLLQEEELVHELRKSVKKERGDADELRSKIQELSRAHDEHVKQCMAENASLSVGLKEVTEQMQAAAVSVWHLQRVVAKKRDPLSHVCFLDVLAPPGAPLLTDRFW
jgi:hypothetical protein